jgi:hypothetical protein
MQLLIWVCCRSLQRITKEGKRWADIVNGIVEDEFAEIDNSNQTNNLEEMNGVVLSALDSQLPTFNTILNVNKIQKCAPHPYNLLLYAW